MEFLPEDYQLIFSFNAQECERAGEGLTFIIILSSDRFVFHDFPWMMLSRIFPSETSLSWRYLKKATYTLMLFHLNTWCQCRKKINFHE